MPLKIEKVKYLLNGVGNQNDDLKANTQDELSAIVTFSIERTIYASNDNRIVFKPFPYMIGSVDNNNVIHSPDSALFTEFVVGDIISAVNVQNNTTSPSRYTIVEKKDNSTIFISPISPSVNLVHEICQDPATESGRVSLSCENVTNLNNLDLFFSLTEKDSDGSYTSQIDGEEVRLTVSDFHDDYANLLNLGHIGGKSHQYFSATYRLLETRNGVKFIFYVIINFRVFPYLSEAQILSIINGEQIDNINYNLNVGLKNYSNSAFELKDSYVDTNLQIGGFNTTFQQTNRTYEVLQVVYSNGNGLIPSLSLNSATTVRIRYRSSSNFINTKLEVTFMVANNSYQSIKDNTKTYEEAVGFNYSKHDFYTADQQGYDIGYRSITTPLTFTTIDANTIDVIFTVNFGDKILDLLAKADNKYILTITEYKLERERSLADYNTAAKYLQPLTLFTDTSTYYYDPSSQYYDITNIQDPLSIQPADLRYKDVLPEVYPTDNIEAFTEIRIPKTSLADLKSFTHSLVAYNNVTNQEVSFSSQRIGLEGYVKDNINGLDIDVKVVQPINQGYKNEAWFSRGTDTNTDIVYNTVFNFIIPERTDKYLTTSQIPTDLFNNGVTKLPYNALYYENQTNWGIVHKKELLFRKDGDDYAQITRTPVLVNDYITTSWGDSSIKIFDYDTGIELISGGQYFMRGKVRIEATFTKSVLPDINNLSAYFYLQKQNEDGVRESFTYNNPISLVERVDIQLSGMDVLVTGIIASDKVAKDCRLYCRLFEVGDQPPNLGFLQAENGDYIQQENGGRIIIDL